MRKIHWIALSILLTTAIFSCNNDPTKKEDDKKTVDTSKTETGVKPTVDSANMSLMVNAKFVDFTLGDASHYTFVDANGKQWDFAENHDSVYKFSVELPKAKSNETNQGWGSDKALQGKWFKITYANKTLQQYEGGPMLQAPVILNVALNEPQPK